MFFILSPSKPHKNRAKSHPKTLPKFEIKFGQKFPKCRKNPKKNEKRERERLPPGVPSVDGEERGRGEVVGMRERDERERRVRLS